MVNVSRGRSRSGATGRWIRTTGAASGIALMRIGLSPLPATLDVLVISNVYESFLVIVKEPRNASGRSVRTSASARSGSASDAEASGSLATTVNVTSVPAGASMKPSVLIAVDGGRFRYAG